MWNISKSNRQHATTGTTVVLTHICSWQQAFNTLGDDRQIIVRLKQNHAVVINETPFTPKTLLTEVSLIMDTRNEKFLWVDAEKSLSYGEVVTMIAALKNAEPRMAIMLVTNNSGPERIPVHPIKQDGQISIPDMDCPDPDFLRP